MTEKLSIKIAGISFCLMVGVVLAHSTTVAYDTKPKDVVWFLQQLYLDKLSAVIVTTFFFISGYLFFLSFKKMEVFCLTPFKEKIKKRFATLVLPYLFWCLFWFLFMYCIQFVPFISRGFALPLHQMDHFQQFYYLFLEPINYPFWFLRELILYVLISPVLYVVIRYMKLFALFVLFVMALFSTSFLTIFDVSIFKYFMLFFYLLGAYSALNSIKLTLNVNPAVVVFMFFSWIFVSAFLLYGEVYFIEKSWLTKLFTNLLIVWGCLSCWLLYDVLDKRYDFKHKSIYNYGFFIYATHGILILFLNKAFATFFVLTQFQLLIVYIFSFVFITLLCFIMAVVFKKYLPKLYTLSTGNR